MKLLSVSRLLACLASLVSSATASPNGMVRFLYYLNPTSLDRNLEFDHQRNLFKERTDGILGHGP